jgi:hypothetical protein
MVEKNKTGKKRKKKDQVTDTRIEYRERERDTIRREDEDVHKHDCARDRETHRRLCASVRDDGCSKTLLNEIGMCV